jgi:hypothetical protein
MLAHLPRFADDVTDGEDEGAIESGTHHAMVSALQPPWLVAR